MRRGAAILFAMLVWIGAVAPALADTMAQPAPDWDNPRKIMLQLTENNAKRASGILSNAFNLQKFYGADNVKIAIVAYAGGVHQLLKAESEVADKVEALLMYDAEVIACRNTMSSLGASDADLLPGVTTATAGIAEIVERKMQGWHYIVP